METPQTNSSPVHTIPVLLRAIRVLEAIANDPGNATTKGLSLSLGIPPTTCYRILQSFVREGWLSPGPDGAFELSFGLIALLRPLLHHDLLIETVRGPLTDLANSTGLTTKLTIQQRGDAVTIFSAPSPKDTAIMSRVGMRASLTIGSSGAALLSALADEEVANTLQAAPETVWKFQDRDEVLRRVAEAREKGFCYDHGSYQPNIHTLSAPLVVPSRNIIAAITLLGFPQDLEPPNRDMLVRQLLFTTGGCLQVINGQKAAV